MKNQKKLQLNILKKKQYKLEQNNQKRNQCKKLVVIKTYFGKDTNVQEEQNYIEVTVTYEVIENIGTQEKIEEIPQTEEIQE